MNNIMTILTILLISSLAISFFYSPNGKWAVVTEINASVISEGNSTYSDPNASSPSSSSTTNDQDISKVIVIQNPQSASSNDKLNSSDTVKSESLNSSTSSAAATETNSKEFSVSASPRASEEVPGQNESIQSSITTSNATQRGEYLVDDNGVHYYTINNCSLVKGSSGIGDLSECEDAERVLKKETGG